MTLAAPLLIQARLSPEDAHRVDQDIATLGLKNRTEAVREGLRLLHRRAQHATLAREYDEFYGNATEAPVSDITAMGDEVAIMGDEVATHLMVAEPDR